MLQPSQDLEQIFESSVRLANDHNHEYVTLEHFLHGMIVNESFAKLLSSFGADVNGLLKDLEKYVSEELKELVNTDVDRPKKTNTVERVLNRAFTQVLFTGRHIIEPVDCFISIFAEKKSHATYFIKKANIDKDKFLNFIQKEYSRDDEPEMDSVKSNSQIEKMINQFCINLSKKFN
jgi:ATP-dependent Clp protease ATP-binding subunit ClpA